MAGTQNSISSLIAQFLRLQKNSLEILNGLNEAAVSVNDSVTIEILDEQGLPKNASIPSYGYLRGEIQRLDNNIKSLAGIGDATSTVRNPDGTYSQVFKVETLKNPPALENLPVPNTFYIKDNWFFESFLSPLLYINVNVTGKISDSADRILVKRIIANTDTDQKRNYFDLNLKGKNDLTYDQFINELTNQGISYFVDEDIISLPLRTIRFIGNFGVVSYYDDVVNVIDSNGNTIQETRRNYKLDTLAYTDTLSNVKDGRTLDLGDKISTTDGTLYQVTSVNKDQASIQAKRVSGYEPIKLGANTLSISSSDFGPRYVQVNVGYNERQGIFFKTIDDNFNIIGSTFSTSIIFFSNELQTKNSDGEVVSLETYYLNSVSDMGKIFLGMAKEKKVPAIEGLIPEVPLITTDNFKVVQINAQITDSTSAKVLEDKIKLKATLKSEIDALDNSINNLRVQINTSNSVQSVTDFSDPSRLSFADNPENDTGGSRFFQRIFRPATKTIIGDDGGGNSVDTSALQAQLNSLIEERSNKVSLYSSLVEEITVLSQETPQILVEAKYRVRGFWSIPNPRVTSYGEEQSVIQFSVRYRYLSDSGAVQPTQQIEYVDTDGTRKTGSFSNWVEYKTDIRKKVYDSSKGVYVWAPEITADSETQNINQLDLPITKGEKIEIQIASVSEAGWPDNPLTSDYSQSAIVSFPDNLAVSGISNQVRTNNEDSAVVKVQTNLNAIGLPLHLSQQFTSGNKTYFHDSNGIASGFFNSSGVVVSLFEKLNDLQNQIIQLSSQITQTKGTLQVYIVDSTGNKIRVSRGSIIKLNAGFYKDIFVNPLTTDAGKIASISYSIQLLNPEAGPVELASSIPGGFDLKAPISLSPTTPPFGYEANLRYGVVPISITSLNKSSVINNTSFRQAPPYASTNAYSQFVYPRYKNAGYNEILYYDPNDSNGFSTSVFTQNSNISYAYEGQTQTNFGVADTRYPQNGTIMIPYIPAISTPSYPSGGTAANVWNGTFTGISGGSPIGNGILSEFCISKDHPRLLQIGSANSFVSYDYLVKPRTASGFEYAPFRHTQCFWGDTSLNNFAVQQAYRDPVTFVTGATASSLTDQMYADKLGFVSDDEFLIGKYSCGAYLFLAPVSGGSLQVTGATSLSTRTLNTGETNAINVPLVFQFRAVDKLGYIGGFRRAGTLSNITYTKKIGIDIQILNSDIFSFDVQISGAYQNDTLVAPNFNSSRGQSYL